MGTTFTWCLVREQARSYLAAAPQVSSTCQPGTRPEHASAFSSLSSCASSTCVKSLALLDAGHRRTHRQTCEAALETSKSPWTSRLHLRRTVHRQGSLCQRLPRRASLSTCKRGHHFSRRMAIQSCVELCAIIQVQKH